MTQTKMMAATIRVILPEGVQDENECADAISETMRGTMEDGHFESWSYVSIDGKYLYAEEVLVGDPFDYDARIPGSELFTAPLHRAAPDMLAALEVIKALIGNVDHSKGGGENSARLYGQMLNDFRDIASAAITKAKGV
jgi:hypothetical protein